jgi:hypothetical protein
VLRARQKFDRAQFGPDQRGIALIRRAITGSNAPRLYVNRDVDDALRLLRGGGRFSTAYDIVRDRSVARSERRRVKEYLVKRRALEQHLGTHGEGAQAGRTVYGTAEFASRRRPRLSGDGYLAAATQGSAKEQTRLNTGFFDPMGAGAVTFILKPRANRRATFLPHDTWKSDSGGPRPVAVEHLPYAVLWHMQHQLGPVHAKRLLRLPRRQAIHGIQRYLASALVSPYIEGQVREAKLDDVSEIRIRRTHNGRRSDPHGAPLDVALAEVRQLARSRGIPVVFEDPPPHVPNGMVH